MMWHVISLLLLVAGLAAGSLVVIMPVIEARAYSARLRPRPHTVARAQDRRLQGHKSQRPVD